MNDAIALLSVISHNLNGDFPAKIRMSDMNDVLEAKTGAPTGIAQPPPDVAHTFLIYSFNLYMQLS